VKLKIQQMCLPQDRVRTADVQAIMREIRSAVRAENRAGYDAARLAKKAVPGHLFAIITRLKASTASLQETASRIGEIPPGPSTARARVGAFFVRLMQRSLFWLIPSIRSSQKNLASALSDHINATEEILRVLQQTNVQVELLRRSLEAQQTASPSPNGQPMHPDGTAIVSTEVDT
jgi:hypothetical protein